MNNLENARDFFDACETGKGWQGCASYCDPNATFDAQANALAEIDTLQAYCDWMAGLFTPVPDGHYDLKHFSYDESTHSALAFAVFCGTQTGEGGPVPPTGNTVASEYVYHIVFDGDKITHMTKIWNDTIGLTQLGWT